MKNNCTIDEIMQFAATSIECCGENETIKNYSTIDEIMQFAVTPMSVVGIMRPLKLSHY